MPESATPDPSQQIKYLSRLRNALDVAYALQPKFYESWSADPDFYSYQSSVTDFMDEQRPHKQRGRRENLCLQASGLMIATHWMDVQPSRRGIPSSKIVETIFKQSNFPEALVVTPLTRVAAADRANPLSDQQRKQLRDAKTFRRLEPLLTSLDPTPHDPDNGYVELRTHPINRRHIASVLQPVVKRLTETLIAEGHYPLNRGYAQQVEDQIRALQRQ